MEFNVARSLFSQVEAVSNKTKLFVCAKGRFSVFDFWNDGAIPVCTEMDSDQESEPSDDDDYEDFEDFEDASSEVDEWTIYRYFYLFFLSDT